MDIDKITEQLRSERERLDRAISALSGATRARRLGRPAGGNRQMSAEGRRRIAQAAKRRWAQWRKSQKKVA